MIEPISGFLRSLFAVSHAWNFGRLHACFRKTVPYINFSLHKFKYWFHDYQLHQEASLMYRI